MSCYICNIHSLIDLMNNKTNIKNDIYFLFNMLKREEELKYLDFIRDVTNDVLERGIFSNRSGF